MCKLSKQSIVLRILNVYFGLSTKRLCTETERLLEWLPSSSLVTLKLSFNVSGSDDQDSCPDDLSVSVWKKHILSRFIYWQVAINERK